MRIPELDGVRGIAILLVLVAHGASVPGLKEPFDSLVNYGWAGVDLFFVLSGYLITSILLKSKSQPDYYRVFYTNRILRIFPAYYTFLLIFPFVYWIPIWRQAGYWFYLGNFMMAAGYGLSYINHFWSLAIEEQFYLLWPFVVRRMPLSRLLTFCTLMIAATIAARFVLVHYRLKGMTFVYVLTPFRWDSLLLGALLACLRMKGKLAQFSWTAKWVALLGFALLSLGISKAHGTRYDAAGTAIYSYLGSDLIFTSLIASVLLWPGAAWLGFARSSFLRFFGKYSYGIYVFNRPISLYLLNSFALGTSPAVRAIECFAVLTALSVAIALISWKLIEEPFLAKKIHHRQLRDDATADAAISRSA